MVPERHAEHVPRNHERDAGAAEVLEPAGMRHLRIDDGGAIGQLLARKMVVRHYDVHTARAKRRHLLDGVDPVVHSYDEPHPRIRREHALDGRVGHSVALAQPLGEERGDLRAYRGKRLHENRRRAHSVAVVVPEYDYPLPRARRGDESLRRLDGAGQLVRGREVPDGRGEERIVVRGKYAAALEDLRDQLWNVGRHLRRIIR